MGTLYPWTEAVARKLLLDRTVLPHAMLLAGARGLGKTDLAMWVAGGLLCNEPDAPCGRCQSCQLLSAASHPDLHVVAPESFYKNSEALFARYAVRYAPEEKSNESKDSTVIRIDQVRSLIEACQKRPQLSGRKVFLLLPAELLNTNAANSLLKILEEPPADSIFLLISHQMARLPATIISRCVRADVPLPSAAVAQNWLKGQGVGDDQVRIALAQAAGAPLEAQRLVQSGFLAKRGGLFADLEAMLGGKDDPVSCAARWKGLGTDYCLHWLHGCLADMVIVLSTDGSATLRNPDLRERLQGIKNRLNLVQLLDFSEILGCRRSLLSGALDEQLALDDILIRWSELGTS